MRAWYLLIAKTFAPVAERALFWLAFRGNNDLSLRDWAHAFVAIVLADLASFALGEIANSYEWFGLF